MFQEDEIHEIQSTSLFFVWIAGFLISWLGWVNDLYISGPKNIVIQGKDEIKVQFDCYKVGET